MVETVPLSVEQAASVRREAARILDHPAFTTSERCTRLLRYLVDRALSDPGVPLKERQVGHEAFGKPVDYDTGAQPIVRNAATETRKRLRQVYSEPGHAGDVRIDLSPGGYLLTFTFHEPGAEHHAIAETVPTFAPVRPVEPPAPPVATGQIPQWLLFFVFTIALLLAGAAGYVIARRPQSHPTAPSSIASSPFWQPIFASQKEVFISVGHAPAFSLGDDSNLPPGLQRFTMTDLRAYTNIAGLLEARGKAFQMRSDRATRIEDLRNRPVILIGAFNNVWVARLTGDLRYHYTQDDRRKVRGIEDGDHPGKNLWETPSGTVANEDTVNYAIAERFKSPMTGDLVVTVSSLGAVGTQAASEFITREDFLNSLPASLADPNKSVQIVLRIPIVDGAAGTPEVIRTHIW